MVALPEPSAEPTTRTRRPRYTPAPLPQTAALYCRVSDPKQAKEDKTSLETQEAELRAAALADGYPVRPDHVYVEQHSGEELYERPILTELRAAAKRREFAAVYFLNVQRLARDAIHQGIVIEELERAGVRVVSLKEPLDDSPDGQLLRFVRGYSGKVENERRREAVIRGMRARAERLGRPIPGPRPPYGFRWGPEVDAQGKPTCARWEFDPVTAPIRRRLFVEIAGGATVRGLAWQLTLEGVPTPTGRSREWAPNTITTLVKDPICWGEAEALRTQMERHAPDVRPLYKRRTRPVLRPEDQRVKLPASVLPPEPLVSRALAEAVARRLAQNRQASPRRNADPDATLLRGGLAVCALCHHPLMVWHGKGRPKRSDPTAERPRRTSYRCRHGMRTRGQACQFSSIEAGLLDGAVWAKVSEVLRHPALIEQEVARMREVEAPGTDTLAVIDSQIADLTRRIRNKRRYAEDIEDDQERRELAREADVLASQRRALEAERRAAEAHYASWQQQQAELEQVVDWAARVQGNLERLTPAERRRFMEAVRAWVEVYPAATPGPNGVRAVLTLDLPVSGALAYEMASDPSGLRFLMPAPIDLTG